MIAARTGGPGSRCSIVTSVCMLMSVAIGFGCWLQSTRVHIAQQPSLMQSAEMNFVLHRGEDCWAPCGNSAGDCPIFCGAGNACCRRGAADPPECHGVTNFWTAHHECVEPVRSVRLKHQGQDCLTLSCRVGGDCKWCGEGNACCKQGDSSDPPECSNITAFPALATHTCVTPTQHVPLKHKYQNCWEFCGNRAGPCSWCGDGNLCCRSGQESDPPECRSVIEFPTIQYHTCVRPMNPVTNSTNSGQLSGLPTPLPTSPKSLECPANHIRTSIGCQKSFAPKAFEIYMYRAVSDEDYPFENVNAANAGGVLRYLHDEVVKHCPRKFSITRIRRFRLIIRTTDKLFAIPPHAHFGPYVAFDKGQCTVPNCPEIWGKYGYVVGCQNQGTSVAHYPHAIWYSVPGRCPSQDFRNKSASCIQQEHGGQCKTPNGFSNCTWHVEDAGVVHLHDLSGIYNYSFRCNEGYREYNPATDQGVGTSFWNGKQDTASCAYRIDLLQRLFKTRYPNIPEALAEPDCDWWR